MYISRIYSKFIPKKEGYDPFRRPPDFLKAEEHSLASRFALCREGIGSVCDCCGFPVYTEPISICTERMKLSFNGAGVPLFFDFIGFVTILLVLLLLSSGIVMIITYGRGTVCESTSICKSQFYNIFSMTNIADGNYLPIYILQLVTIVLIMGASVYYRRWMMLIIAEIDRANISISDYSIQVSNMPKNSTHQEIYDFFLELSSGIVHEVAQIVEINMGYDIQYYNELNLKKLEIGLKLFNLQDQIDRDIYLREYFEVDQDLQKIEKNFQQECQFSGVAFITFNSHQHALEIIDYFNASYLVQLKRKIQGCFQLKKQLQRFKRSTPIIEIAPEPGDVLWENLGIDQITQFKYQILTNLASFLILCLCFGLILGISIGQDKLYHYYYKQSNLAYALITVLGIIASIIITALNALMAYFSHRLVQIERHKTQTEFNISFAYKLGTAQFLNTAIVPLLVNIFLAGGSMLDRMQDSGGLNQDMTIVFITNSISSWLIVLLDPLYYYQLYLRKKALSKGKNSDLTQREANHLFEGPEANLAEKYASVLKTISLTFFYASLLPLGIIFSIFSLITFYWVEKWCFSKRYARGPTIGSQLGQEMVSLFMEINLALFAAGNIIWQQLLNNDVHPIFWVQLGITLASLLAPYDCLFNVCLTKPKEPLIFEEFTSLREEIIDDYAKRNPVTMQKSIERWIKSRNESNTVLMKQFQRIALKKEEQVYHLENKIMTKLRINKQKYVSQFCINQQNDMKSLNPIQVESQIVAIPEQTDTEEYSRSSSFRIKRVNSFTDDK